jgi:hypothetical protein
MNRSVWVGWVAGTALGWGACVLCAAAPPNDDFINRIHVEGEDVVLHAVMDGSTLEQMRDPASGHVGSESLIHPLDFNCIDLVPDLSIGSVWWTWTAPRSGTVVIKPESEPGLVHDSSSLPGLACFLPADLNAPSVIFRLGDFVDYTQRSCRGPRYPFAGFHAVQGSTYVLQVGGYAKGSHTFRLLMPGEPHLSEQPLDKTLVAGESSFLHVTATGTRLEVDPNLQPLRYQWLHGEIPIEGQTYSTLALTSVTAQHAGNYRVIVSDLEGSATSVVARVVVNATEAPPSITVNSARHAGSPRTRSPTWRLQGEPGRYYVLESSTNLVDWQWQAVEPVSPLAEEPLTVTGTRTHRPPPSHVRLRKEPFEFWVSTAGERLFLRARRMDPAFSSRSAALWILQQAKEDWGRNTRWRRFTSDTPTAVEIAYRIHPGIRPAFYLGENECGAHIQIGNLGEVPIWPCISFEPALWAPGAYFMANPGLVWNPAR